MSYDKKTFNPKKHADQRRKRPVYGPTFIPKVKYVEVKRKSRAGVEHTHYVRVDPVPERGKNRQAYRIELAKDRKGIK